MTIKTALVVIDVQSGMFDASDPVHAGPELLLHISHLIEKARNAAVPVVYVQHNGPPGSLLEPHTPAWDIHPAIAPREDDAVIQKTTPDSFHETELQLVLGQRGIENLVLCGIQTDVCVDTTCRRAYSFGYNVVLVSDAHSTWDRGKLTAGQIVEHHNDVLRWFAETTESTGIQF